MKHSKSLVLDVKGVSNTDEIDHHLERRGDMVSSGGGGGLFAAAAASSASRQ